MVIVIEMKNKITKLILKKDSEMLDELIFLADENISEKLLPNFDALLKKNKLTLKEIENIEIDTDLGDNFTSKRIAEAMRNAFLWSKREQGEKSV